MKPARMPSARVKILPWYYTDRNAPSRAEDEKRAIDADLAAAQALSSSVPERRTP